MGLDMYFNRRTKESEEVGYLRKANQVFAWIERHCLDDDDETIANCQDVKLSKRNIQDLLATCKEVIVILDNATYTEKKIEAGWKNVKNEETGEIVKETLYHTILVVDSHTAEILQEKMPTQRGFFFGSNEYDKEDYRSDILSTIKICEKILAETDFETQEIVFSAWW